MKQSKSKSFIFAFISDLGSVPIQILNVLVLIPIIILKVPAESYGNWLTIISLFGILAYADLSYGVPFTREIALISHKKNYNKINELYNSIFLCLILFSVIFFIILFLSKHYILNGIISINSNDFEKIFTILLTAFSIDLIFGIYGTLLNGFKKMFEYNLIKIFSETTSFLFSIIFLIFDFGIIVLAYSFLLKIIINSICTLYFTNKFFLLKLNLNFFSKKIAIKIFKKAFFYQVGRFNEIIHSNLDNIIINSFIGPISVVVYSITSKAAILFSRLIPSKLTASLYPFLTELFEKKEIKKLKEILNILFFISLRFGFFLFLSIVFFNEEFIEIWVGNDFFGGMNLNFVFGIFILIEILYSVPFAFLLSFGEYKKWSFYSLVEGISNIVLSIFLIQYLSILGVALATVISRILLTFSFVLIRSLNNLNVNKTFFLKNNILNPVIKMLINSLFILLILIQFQNINLILKFTIFLILFIVLDLIMFERKIVFKKKLTLKNKLKLIIKNYTIK